MIGSVACVCAQERLNPRRYLDALSMSRRIAVGIFCVEFILRIEDLRRGIDLAFEVPETHLAAAIAYLLGVGSEDDDFPAPIVEKFQTLVTPKGWSLCVDLLKFRLEMRARKLGNAGGVSQFTDGGQKC